MSESHAAVGSYAVNALDRAELDEFEAHLETCETCRREVSEFAETVAELSLLAATRPPALRDSILGAIKEVRPRPPQEPREVMTSPETASPTPDHPQSVPPAPALVQPPVDELALRRQRRRTRILTAAVAAVMVVALALGGWVYTLVQNRQAQVAEAALETQLFSAPDVKIYAQTMANGGKASFVVSQVQNQALFIGTDLPDAGQGKRYQLWTLTPTPDADSLFDGGASRKQWFDNPVTDASGLAVSIEPAGGATVPSDIQALAQF
jgi:anti-sigma factor RsiW